MSLLLDVLLALLLVVTIGYAAVLNGRLKALRGDRDELEKVALSFGEATARAEESIGRLKATASELQGRIDRAPALNDDLAFLIDRGGATADRLEDKVRGARRNQPGSPPQGGVEPRGVEPRGVEPRGVEPRGVDTPSRPAPADTEEEIHSEAERELIRALKSVR